MEYYAYLAHHGIKGQKWGVRRFQNADGTLTDEGRRHYGYGRDRNRPITNNTVDRTLGGLKKGAKIGAGVYGVGNAAYAGLAVAAIGGGPVAAVGAAALSGALGAASGALSGGVFGAEVGFIAGALETRAGRKYIEKNDTGLAEFEKRDKV